MRGDVMGTTYRLVREYTMKPTYDFKKLVCFKDYEEHLELVIEHDAEGKFLSDPLEVKYQQHYVDDDFYDVEDENTYYVYTLTISKRYCSDKPYDEIVNEYNRKKDDSFYKYCRGYYELLDDFNDTCQDVLEKVKLTCASLKANDKKVNYEDIKLVVEDI